MIWPRSELSCEKKKKVTKRILFFKLQTQCGVQVRSFWEAVVFIDPCLRYSVRLLLYLLAGSNSNTHSLECNRLSHHSYAGGLRRGIH
jgi:hypothetical protein